MEFFERVEVFGGLLLRKDGQSAWLIASGVGFEALESRVLHADVETL